MCEYYCGFNTEMGKGTRFRVFEGGDETKDARERNRALLL